ncbi:MAG: NADH-quinone oxidoreductase subunit J [Acidobacteria bacterium]|nr:MAG: NADH-quinone oxidoreductase subunit J [Acidobacteriota bacterium]
MDAILFLIFAAIALGCAVNLVLQTHPIASALSLIGVMGALAALYLLLGGEFIAAAQLIVYAGAIMVLFVFVIMLLNAGAEQESRKRLAAKVLGIPLLVVLLGLVGYVLQNALLPSEGVKFGAFRHGTAQDVGRSLFTIYLLPFEVTSVLILVAILGAVILARKEID